jgi:hypothetical protein
VEFVAIAASPVGATLVYDSPIADTRGKLEAIVASASHLAPIAVTPNCETIGEEGSVGATLTQSS